MPFMRIQSRVITLSTLNPDYYTVDLVLSNKGIAARGGGSSGFPKQSGSVTILQQAVGAGNQTLASPVTAGSTLVLVTAERGGTPTTPTGFTVSPEGVDTMPSSTNTLSIFTKAADGSEPQGTASFVSFAGLDSAVGYYELSAGAAVGTSGAAGNASITTVTMPGVSMATGDLAIFIGAVVAGDATPAPIITPGAGLTTDFNGKVFDGSPFTLIARHAATGSETFVASCSESIAPTQMAGQIVTFTAGAASAPPTPGQWVYGETPTPAPGGGRVTFATANPYATGSLRVRVDHVDQTAATTETDPTNGSFTLAFDPRSWETLTVDYQGR